MFLITGLVAHIFSHWKLYIFHFTFYISEECCPPKLTMSYLSLITSVEIFLGLETNAIALMKNRTLFSSATRRKSASTSARPSLSFLIYRTSSKASRVTSSPREMLRSSSLWMTPLIQISSGVSFKVFVMTRSSSCLLVSWTKSKTSS